MVKGLQDGISSGDWKNALLSTLVPLIASAWGQGSEEGGGLLGNIGGIFGGIPRRQSGGSARRGMPYLVGENGPELFVPGQTGFVNPLQRSAQQRNMTPVINQNFNYSGVDFSDERKRGIIEDAGLQALAVQQQLERQ